MGERHPWRAAWAPAYRPPGGGRAARDILTHAAPTRSGAALDSAALAGHAHVSGFLPGFATIENVGRRSGKTYQSPINVFFRDGQAAFALTYGADVHWVHNVLAAGSCRIQSRGRSLRLEDPELIVDPQRRPMPRWLRPMLGLFGATSSWSWGSPLTTTIPRSAPDQAGWDDARHG